MYFWPSWQCGSTWRIALSAVGAVNMPFTLCSDTTRKNCPASGVPTGLPYNSNLTKSGIFLYWHAFTMLFDYHFKMNVIFLNIFCIICFYTSWTPFGFRIPVRSGTKESWAHPHLNDTYLSILLDSKTVEIFGPNRKKVWKRCGGLEREQVVKAEVTFMTYCRRQSFCISPSWRSHLDAPLRLHSFS